MMFSVNHQRILRRVRRLSRNRNYVLQRFRKIHDDALGTEYTAFDRFDKELYVLVCATHSNEEPEDIGKRGVVLCDKEGYVFTALFCGPKAVLTERQRTVDLMLKRESA